MYIGYQYQYSPVTRLMHSQKMSSISQKLSSAKVVIVSLELLLIYRTYLFRSMLIASRLAALYWTTFGKIEIETSNDTVPNAHICHTCIMYNIVLYYILMHYILCKLCIL